MIITPNTNKPIINLIGLLKPFITLPTAVDKSSIGLTSLLDKVYQLIR